MKFCEQNLLFLLEKEFKISDAFCDKINVLFFSVEKDWNFTIET